MEKKTRRRGITIIDVPVIISVRLYTQFLRDEIILKFFKIP